MKTQKKGFTLIELLVVIAIIVALAVAVFVALNPGQRLADARDARRTSDTDSILTAVHEYIVDNGGTSPITTDGTEYQIGTAVTGCATSSGGCAVAGATDCLDVTSSLVGTYLASTPLDPSGGTLALTGYSVIESASGLVTVKACGAEGTTISVSR